MPLLPTTAESCAEAFQAQTRTTPMKRFAEAFACTSIVRNFHGIHYGFPDGSLLSTRGTGRNHRITTQTPGLTPSNLKNWTRK